MDGLCSDETHLFKNETLHLLLTTELQGGWLGSMAGVQQVQLQSPKSGYI